MGAKKSLQLSAMVGDCFIMAKIGLDKLKSFSEAELKILLYIAQEGGIEPGRLAGKLGIDSQSVEEAVKKLTESGLVSLGEDKIKKPSKNAVSNYDGEELADAIDDDDGFKAVTNFARDILEKQLNRNDLNTLYALYDYHGFSAEMICGIVEYCVSTGKRSMSYIFNTALSIREDGISTYDELELYIKEKRTLNTKAARFRKLCGIGNRELTARERGYTDRWFGEMHFGFELVKKAYELTIDRIGEPKFAYMSKILEQWHAKGVRNLEDAEKLLAKRKAEKKEESSDYDIESYFVSAAKKGFIKEDDSEN